MTSTEQAAAFLLSFVCCCGQAPSGQSQVDRCALPKGRIDMVLDSDMYNEVDDQFALALAVRSPERIALRAVYAAPFLNHRSTSPADGMQKSYDETLRVLKLLGVASDRIVLRGSDRFLPDRKTPVDSPAARHLIRLAHQPREQPLIVVGLGAASNLASALLLDSSISDHVVFVWIGGHPHSWPHARDFNLKQDVAAAQVLFDSGVPLVHVPAGDVAAQLKITLRELEIGLKEKSAISDALYRNVEQYFNETQGHQTPSRSTRNTWQKVIWDIATIAWLLDPEELVRTKLVASPRLDDDGKWQNAANRHMIRVATQLDRERIFETLFAALSSVASDAQDTATVVTPDGAWCWFQDPRAVYIGGQHERTYLQWMTHDGKLQVGAFDHKTRQTEVHTLQEHWDRDDHNVGAFLVLPDNRLMAFYARHNKRGIFCRTTLRPEQIEEWDDEVAVCDSPRITYAHPVYLSKEKRFYVFWRGASWKPTFATSSDGIAWSEPQVLLQDVGRQGSNIRPYTKIVSDGESTIHFAFTDGHPRDEFQNSVYYLKYHNGRFIKADGSPVGNMDQLPIRHSRSDLVYDAKKTNIRAWVWDIAIDDRGHPVIAYTRFPTETDHRYCYARWTGDTWLDVEITPGGGWFPQTLAGRREPEPHYSGGIALDHSNPSTLFVSRPVDGIFEIERWSSPDNGANWRSRPITSNSQHINIRPVVPRGNAGSKSRVVWMFGEYQHYTKYETGIKLLEMTSEN